MLKSAAGSEAFLPPPRSSIELREGVFFLPSEREKANSMQTLEAPRTDLLTTSQTARRIGLTPNRIRQLADQGALPAVITSPIRLFDLAVVDAFARRRADRTQGADA